MESIAKVHVSQKLLFMDFGIDLCGFVEVFGAVFLVFAALETGMKTAGFSGWVWIRNSWVAVVNHPHLDSCEQLVSGWPNS